MATKKAGFDLASLDTAVASEAAYDHELINPFDGEPTGLFVQVLGFNSEAVRNVKREQEDRQKKRSFEQSRTGKLHVPTAAEDEAEGLEVAVAGTIGWYEKKNGNREEGLPLAGTRLMFSKDEAQKLFANPGLAWIGAQVVRAMYDLGNFTNR